MNKFFRFASFGFMALAVVATGCSDDNKEKDEPTPENPVEPGYGNVLTQGLPANIDGATFTTNDKGQVTKITDGDEVITFEYGKFTRATDFSVKMSCRYNDGHSDDGSDIYMQLNEYGFVTYALQEYLDKEDGTATWRFEYNADGQLTRLQRSEGGHDFKIAYTDGDITKVTQDEEDGDHREYTFAYTNDSFKSAVANKGNIILFDDMFQIDMDEMSAAYFAGLLGRSTKNLPMGYTEKSTEGGSDYTNSETYGWEFNTNNLPVKFWEVSYPEDVYTFAW